MLLIAMAAYFGSFLTPTLYGHNLKGVHMFVLALVTFWSKLSVVAVFAGLANTCFVIGSIAALARARWGAHVAGFGAACAVACIALGVLMFCVFPAVVTLDFKPMRLLVNPAMWLWCTAMAFGAVGASMRTGTEI